MVRRCGGSAPQAYRSELHALPAAESPVLLDPRRAIPAAGGPDPGGHPALCLYAVGRELGDRAVAAAGLAPGQLHQHSARRTSGAEHPVRTGGRVLWRALFRARGDRLARHCDRDQCRRRAHSDADVVLSPRQEPAVGSGRPRDRLRGGGVLFAGTAGARRRHCASHVRPRRYRGDPRGCSRAAMRRRSPISAAAWVR